MEANGAMAGSPIRPAIKCAPNLRPTAGTFADGSSCGLTFYLL